LPTYLRTRTEGSELREVILGSAPADLLFRGGQLVNVAAGEIYEADISVKGDRIAAVDDAGSATSKARKIIDLRGRFVTPGMIDGHIHLESSMLTVDEFSSLVIPHGTTAISADFHEIANILGMKGMRLFHKIMRDVPLRIFPVVPSSVPLSDTIEIANKSIGLKDVEEMMRWDDVLGLGEILNVHSLVTGSKDLDDKIRLAVKHGKFIDGNAAGINGRELQAYIASGPQHDHEAVSKEEAMQRLRWGMWVMLREGSSERNLHDLIDLVAYGKVDSRRFCFATDDKTPHDLKEEGHLDHSVRKSIQLGIDPIKAVQFATINCAEYLGLERELGSIAPGKIADLLIVDDLKKFNVMQTVIGGEIVSENGKMLLKTKRRAYPKFATHTFHISRRIVPADLEIRTAKNGSVKIRLIDVTQGTIISKTAQATLTVQNSEMRSDVQNDFLKVVVVERYGKTNIAIGKGFITGFGLNQGALASSIAHDTHNIISVGTNDVDIAAAVNRVAELQGGLVAVKNGSVLVELKLTLDGIISTDPWESVSENLLKLHEIVKNQLGCKMKSPFMVLSFQTSASIPELKISTLGLIDMPSMKQVPLEYH
jgi:adenine deaminase